jgi:hypothetical protein
MAPKKSASKAPGAQQEAKMRAQHNKELSDLASKARRDAFDASAAGQAAAYVRVSVVLALLGIYAQASQLALSPVYGGIPASVSHAGVLAAGCFLGWAGNLALRHALPNSLSAARLLPVAAAWAPISRLLVDGLSEQLGVFWGPLATEAVTLVPVAVLSAACVADGLEGRKVTELLPAAVADSLPGIGSWAGFKLAEAAAAAWLRPRVGSVFLYTRMGLEMLLAASYAALAPSRWLALAVPALLHTVAFNTHVQVPWATATLNATVAADGWLLLDRAESLTGYLSVLENTERKFRVLRCDHSLLGGQWVMPMGPGQTVAEPIYGIFVMLEAVRLAEPPRGVAAVADDDAKALVMYVVLLQVFNAERGDGELIKDTRVEASASAPRPRRSWLTVSTPLSSRLTLVYMSLP